MEQLLERFCRYVKVETTADEDAKEYPSSSGQWDLGKMLADELKALKVEDVKVSEHGIVTATIPGNVPGAPTVAWLAHMDTSPEASGKDVKPQIHRNYNGQDITLPGDTTKVITVEDAPQLRDLKGKTVITSDGTTLLGADDKAGVAVIITTADYLMSHPDIKHGPIRICFSCDEEVGRGADHIDIKELGAVAAYTLDGEGHGCIEAETFSADQAIVTVEGYNIHPGLAHGKMVNAIRILSEFIARMPWQTMSPETTCGRQQFMHPYVMPGGGVDAASVRIILRSFETEICPSRPNFCARSATHWRRSSPKPKSRSTSKSSTATCAKDSAESLGRCNLQRRPWPTATSSTRWRAFAAAPTARGSPRWACPRPTSPPACTTSTHHWSSAAWRR